MPTELPCAACEAKPVADVFHINSWAESVEPSAVFFLKASTPDHACAYRFRVYKGLGFRAIVGPTLRSRESNKFSADRNAPNVPFLSSPEAACLHRPASAGLARIRRTPLPQGKWRAAITMGLSTADRA